MHVPGSHGLGSVHLSQFSPVRVSLLGARLVTIISDTKSGPDSIRRAIYLSLASSKKGSMNTSFWNSLTGARSSDLSSPFLAGRAGTWPAWACQAAFMLVSAMRRTSGPRGQREFCWKEPKVYKNVWQITTKMALVSFYEMLSASLKWESLSFNSRMGKKSVELINTLFLVNYQNTDWFRFLRENQASLLPIASHLVNNVGQDSSPELIHTQEEWVIYKPRIIR